MVTLGLGASLIFAIHPMSGLFLFTSMGLMALLEREVSSSVRLAMIGTIVGAAFFSLLWPYFPIGEAILASSQYDAIGFESNYGQWYLSMHLRSLPGLLALPAIWYALRSRKSDLLVFGLVAFSLAYVANFMTVRSAVGGRLVIYIIFFTQILIVRSMILWRGTRFGAIITMLVLSLIVGAGSPQIGESIGRLILVSSDKALLEGHDRLDTGTNFEMLTRFKRMSEHLTTKDVLLAREIESWVIPSLLGCQVVTVANANPFMTDFKSRKIAVRRFFDSEMSKTEVVEFIDDYQITHALIRTDSRITLGALLSDYKVVWSGCGYELLLLSVS